MAPPFADEPNIRDRASRRVPLKFSTVVMNDEHQRDEVVAMGVLSTPTVARENGATPVATPAMVQHRAQA